MEKSGTEPIHDGHAIAEEDATVRTDTAAEEDGDKETCSHYSRQPGFVGPTRPRAEELEKVGQLGAGNFSKIYLAEEYRTGRRFALKEYLKQDAERRKKTQDLVMEKYVLNKLAGLERTVRLHETFKDEASVYFCMEYLPGGELWSLVHPFGLPSRAEAKYYFCKIVLAVQEIHARGIVHRDLKPENIMLNAALTDLKLVDFATAWDLLNPEMKGAGNGSTGRRVYYHFVGTPQYMPVEAIRNQGSFAATDVYALGCILYQLLAGFPPHTGPGEYQIFQKTDKGQVDFYDFFSADERALIAWMTQKVHTDRPTVEQVLAHEYFRDDLQFYCGVADSLEQVKAKRTKQEQWLHELKKQVLASLAHFDELEEIENKENENKEKPKILDEHGEELPVNHPENKPPVFRKEEKMQLIKEMIEQAVPLIPEGEMSLDIMKSKVRHLRKQLQHKAKVKVFEHYC